MSGDSPSRGGGGVPLNPPQEGSFHFASISIQFNFVLLILNPPDIGLQSNKHKQKTNKKDYSG